MSDIRRSEFRIGLTAALLASLAGCHASSPRATSPDRAPPPQSPALSDASYDWHGLLIAPFGSVLKEIPLTLHEVLLFRDEAHGATAADEAECYAGDTPPPRFVGRTPDEYLLCFKQDRLSRVQASVRLSAAEAPEIFAAACARWSKQATPATVSPGTEGAGATGDAAQSSATCEGHDGGIHFRGRLEAEPDRAQSPQGEQVISITLDSPPAP
jgi:hypothetical protein